MLPVRRAVVRLGRASSSLLGSAAAPVVVQAERATAARAGMALAISRIPAAARHYQQQQQHDQQQRPGGAGMREMTGRNSLFVANVPLEVTPNDVKEWFSKYGPVRDAKRGASGTFWFINFDTPEIANQVKDQADGTFWNGRRLRIAARSAPEVSPGRDVEKSETLFIGNMPYSITDDDLNQLSRKLEHCFDIRVAIDRHSGWPRGYCHADFYTAGLAARAFKHLLLSNPSIGGMMLRINFARPTGSDSSAFSLGRARALRSSGRTMQYYIDLERKLREKEGDWDDIPQQ